jgi:rhizoxin synthesis polyketide synthase RhiC
MKQPRPRHLTIEVPGDVLLAPSLKRSKAVLAQLCEAGVAVMHAAKRCHFMADPALDLPQTLDALGEEQRTTLLQSAPLHELFVPASEEQERNLYHSEIIGSPIWNVRHLYRSNLAVIDPRQLRQSFAQLAQNQDLLRTRFLPGVGERWMQVVGEQVPRVTWLAMENVRSLQRFLVQQQNQKLDVAKATPLNCWVSHIQGDYYFGFVAHHALADAFTTTLLFNQWMTRYAALQRGQSVAPAPRQYWQYALQARHGSEQTTDGSHLDFWRQRLAPRVVPMRLPYAQDPTTLTPAHPRQADSHVLTLPQQAVTALEDFNKAHGITYTQCFTAALNLLLTEGMGNDRASLQMLYSRRDRVPWLDAPGEFSNVAIIPYQVERTDLVITLLRQTRQQTLEAFAHPIGFKDLLEISGLRSLQNYFAFRGEVMIDSADVDAVSAASQNEHGVSCYADAFSDPQSSGIGIEGDAPATLFYQFLKVAGKLILVCSWRKALFHKPEIQALSALLVQLVRRMVADPHQPVAALVEALQQPFDQLAQHSRRFPAPASLAWKMPSQSACNATPSLPFFTECQRINQGGSGNPLFWVHGAFGDASIFVPLAQHIPRPFYGLQARGLFDEHQPLHGVEAIATFYTTLIRAIQPQGPYDLGGYSIGGSFAYEIARLLQQQGESVRSLVLVDALYPSEHSRIVDTRYDHYAFVAMGLVAVALRHDRQDTLARLKDLSRPAPSDDEQVLQQQFVSFCIAAGVNKSATWIAHYLQRMVAIQSAYGIARYQPRPLPRPIVVTRYFRNHKGLFYGKRAAHLNGGDQDPLVGVDYWSCWSTLLPQLRFETLEVDNHLEMLSEQHVIDAIAAYCASIDTQSDVKPSVHHEQQRAASEQAAADQAPIPRRLESDLVRLLAKLLEQPQSVIHPDTPFEQLGFDSLLATQMHQHLQQRFGALPMTLMFDHHTISQLAHWLCKHQGALLAQAADDQAAGHSLPENLAEKEVVSQGPEAREEPSADLGIAIIGLSGRYPKANDLEAFWHVLREGLDCVTEVPPERWDWHRFYTQDRTTVGAHYSKWGGFIDDVDRFDPLFFGISPREAAFLDPQERLFLEHAWKAMEDAGYRRKDLGGSSADPYARGVSVYAGVMYGEYQFFGVEASHRAHQRHALGGSYASVANRVSYCLNLHGPSMALDSACSSSLSAIHMACLDLSERRADYAFAGGVNLSLHPNKYQLLSAGQFISSQGRCESFGEGGDGFIPAEGVGVVLLKRLDDAERDGDHIYGVIRGSAINHGGYSNGYTVPNPQAQQQVIRQALHQSGMDARRINYVEAHGTGTQLGDPIEIAALTQAYRAQGDLKNGWCRIGSAKSNFGHCEAAAGVAGLTKVLLQMRHGEIAPSLHCATLNPHIQFEATPFVVNRSCIPWEQPRLGTQRYPRAAGISSFGAGGSNAHLIVEEYVARHDEVSLPKARCIVVLSARTESQLHDLALNLARFVEAQERIDLRNLAWTLQVGREAMTERLAWVVREREELLDGLHAFTQGLRHELLRGSLRGARQPLGLFAQEEWQEVVAKWVRHKKWEQVAEFWIRGGEVMWEDLYQDAPQPRRLSLPTYPFARERHWFEDHPARAAEKTQQADPLATQQTLLAHPHWYDLERPDSAVSPRLKPLTRIAVSCGFSPRQTSDARTWLCFDDKALEGVSLAESFCHLAGTLFEQLQKLLHLHRDALLVQVVVDAQNERHRLCCALTGLLSTLRREYPQVSAQLIEWDGAAQHKEGDLEGLLDEDAKNSEVVHIRHKQGVRQGLGWIEVVSSSLPPTPWREDGVYLISGGTGALGRVFAADIAACVARATLVLFGRSPRDTQLRNTLEQLQPVNKPGIRILYRRADVSQRGEVQALISALCEEGIVPTVVIHGAGIIRDNFMIKKDRGEFDAVMASKVAGVVALDEATAHLPLDLFVLFSSLAGALGNAGQADYATANAFLDAYAEYRAHRVAAGERKGRTLSVDWPLWREGGMGVDEVTTRAIDQSYGMQPMHHTVGVRALHHMLAVDQPRIAVIAGDVGRIRAYLIPGVRQVRASPDLATSQTPITDKHERSEAQPRAELLPRLCELFGAVVKLPAEQVDVEGDLEGYGIDSVMITELNRHLAQSFGEVTKTLFFEFRSLADIADHLLEQYPHQCALWCSQTKRSKVDQSEPQKRSPESAPSVKAAPPQPTGADDPIAIIGIAGRYADAADLEQFWDLLRNGRDAVVEVPEQRRSLPGWSLPEFFEADVKKAVSKGKSYCKWGGFLPRFDHFDPLFFNISPREARCMDPQERLLMQSAWHTMEDAGYTRERMAQEHQGRVGVFAGITSTGFDLYGPEVWQRGGVPIPRTSFSSVANRISYFLDLKGPSMAIDTMCSSSLSALHEACRCLRDGSCSLVLVGAVNLYTHAVSYRNLSANRMLSVDGRCKSFGEGGNGFVPGEGVGCVLLKPLSAAQRDNDPIHALIRASQVNHGGKTHGYTVPNPNAQADLIEETLRDAGVKAPMVSYFEAHGTGTELGDPIEVRGMTQAFHRNHKGTGFCALGSVKSNIGHLEAAAGMAGIAKIVLQMKHQQLVPSLHAQRPNPNIDFSQTPFVLQQKLSEWHRPRLPSEIPRIACLSSFGAGGSNAHVVLEEYTPPTPEVQNAPSRLSAQSQQVLLLSARTEERLHIVAADLLHFLQSEAQARVPSFDLRDLAVSLQKRREAMEVRLGFLAQTLEQVCQRLRRFVSKVPDDTLYQGDIRSCKETLAAQRNDPAHQQYVADLLDQEALKDLLALWCQGYPIAWETCCTKERGRDRFRPVALPLYPFAQERYWFEDLEGGQDQVSAPRLPDPLAFVPTWRRSGNTLSEQAPCNYKGILLLYGAQSQRYGQWMVPELRQRFPQARIDTARLDQLTPEQWPQMLHPDIEWIVFLGDGAGLAKDQDALEQSFKNNELQLLYLVKWVSRRYQDNPKAIDGTLISVDHWPLRGAARYQGGGLWGIAFAIAQSQPGLRIRTLDLSSAELETKAPRPRLMQQILAEPPSQRGEGVRLQQGVRFQQVLLPLHWEEPPKDEPGLQSEGVYLILGGSGQVGGAITRRLMSQYRARVVWIGRRPEHAPEISERIQACQVQGHTPYYFQADALDAQGLNKTLQRILEQLGNLNGAFFAAKEIELENTIESADVAAFTRIAAIKCAGILNLYRALQDHPLDFFCCFSSVQAFAFLPANESVAYASAITAADALARSLRAESAFPIGIVNWGYWANSVAGTEVEAVVSKHFRVISDDEGFLFLRRFIAALRRGALWQALCVGGKASVQQLLNPYSDTSVVLAARSKGGLSLAELLKDQPPCEPAALLLTPDAPAQRQNPEADR